MKSRFGFRVRHLYEQRYTEVYTLYLQPIYRNVMLIPRSGLFYVSLARPHLRPRVLVRPISNIDVNRKTRILHRISAREGDKRTRVARAATRDRNLGAGNVELRRTRNMQPDMLGTEEVVAFRQRRRDGGVDLGHLGLEVGVRAALVPVLVDLEPDVAGGLPGGDVLAVRHARHVEERRARVAHAVAGLEADFAAGGDGEDVGGGAVGGLVAAEEVRVEVLERFGAGDVLGLTDELPVAGLYAVDDGVGEVV